jgi:hypothetical protein
MQPRLKVIFFVIIINVILPPTNSVADSRTEDQTLPIPQSSFEHDA